MRICKFDEVTSIYGRGGPGLAAIGATSSGGDISSPAPSTPATAEPTFAISPAPASALASQGGAMVTSTARVGGSVATGVITSTPAPTTTNVVKGEVDPAFAPAPSVDPSPADPGPDPGPADPGPADAPAGTDYGGWGGEGSTGGEW